MGANDGRWQSPATISPQTPDCRGGVFATRRFPRPPQYTYTMPPTETPVFITTRRATSLRTSLPICACAPHRHSMRIPCPPSTPPTYGAPMVFTTMRHVASLRSSNNCKCLIETFFIARVKSPLHKRLNPCGLFSAAPLLEYGGLKPILPFLGGRSDAACRVVIWPSRPHLWEPMVFITPRWLGRAFATLDTSPTKRAMAPLRGRK